MDAMPAERPWEPVVEPSWEPELPFNMDDMIPVNDSNNGLSCDEQLSMGYMDMGFMTRFDNDNGFVQIVKDSACWDEMVQGVRESSNFVREQLETLEMNGVDMQANGLMSSQEYTQLTQIIGSYTDGDLIVSHWQWNKRSLDSRDHAGLCIQQGDSQNNASCWAFEKLYDDIYTDNKSYLVNMNNMEMAEDSESYIRGQNQIPSVLPGLFGGWMCGPPLDMGEIVAADCLRFIPTASYANPQDPLFNEGPLNVFTYLSSRQRTQNALMKETENENVHMAQGVFQKFTVDLENSANALSGAFVGVIAALMATQF